MDILSVIWLILGLCVFETITTIDNSIINAEVLSGMGVKARRWFLVWGIFFAVFAWVIVWATTPPVGFEGGLTATFSNDPAVIKAIKESSPLLFMGGGVFLLFLGWPLERWLVPAFFCHPRF